MPATMKSQTGERTDAEIAREIRRKMKADFEVPDDRIVTRVVEGFVTIEGIVVRDTQKKAAETCVSNVRGVRGVTNKITVEAAALPVET